MFTMLAVLFFGLTGITLNHPEWTFGGGAERKVEGKLQPGHIRGEEVDWLPVAEQIRAEVHARGRVSDNRVDAGEGSLSFRAPGYGADCFFDLKDGAYECAVKDQGALGLLNDLHRGRDSGANWGWLVDLSGVFLSLVSFTGLGILFYLKKSRKAGLLLMAAGAVVVVVLGWLAMR